MTDILNNHIASVNCVVVCEIHIFSKYIQNNQFSQPKARYFRQKSHIFWILFTLHPFRAIRHISPTFFLSFLQSLL